MKKSSKAVKIATAAIMLAMAFGLSYVKVFELPYGGSITILSMLPICIVSIKYGLAWGLGTGFCFSWLQILQGGVFSWGLTPGMLIASLLLDYIVAFTVLGLAGMLRKKGVGGMIAGTVIACVLRFIVHFIAGVVLWANLEQFVAFGQSFVGRPVLYSILYNGSYMLPETIITVAGAAILFGIPAMRKLLRPVD